MSEPKQETPPSQKEDSSKTRVEPLIENELGEVEGGFSEVSGVSINIEENNPLGCAPQPTNSSQCTS